MIKGMSKEEIYGLAVKLQKFEQHSEELIRSEDIRYENERKSLLKRQQNERTALGNAYAKRRENLQNNPKIAIAQKSFNEIDRMHKELLRMDKEYSITYNNPLANPQEIADKYMNTMSDECSALCEMEKNYRALCKELVSFICPTPPPVKGLGGVVNHCFAKMGGKADLTYMKLHGGLDKVKKFANLKRRVEIELNLCDFRQIAEVLINRVSEKAVYSGIQQEQGLKAQYFNEDRKLQEKHAMELKELETKRIGMGEMLQRISRELDQILPDSTVRYMNECISRYTKRRLKINMSEEIEDGVLCMSFIKYPLDSGSCRNEITALIKKKCEILTNNGKILLPYVMSLGNTQPWMFKGNEKNREMVLDFTYSVISSIFSRVPVGRFACTVIDPVGKGKSITFFKEAIDKMPDYFMGLVDQQEIADQLSELAVFFEQTARELPDIALSDVLPSHNISMVLYDFPNGFNEEMLENLKKILKYGGRCGLCAFIHSVYENLDVYPERIRMQLAEIEGMTNNIWNFQIGKIPFVYYRSPENEQFNKFVNKYALLLDGKKESGSSFSPLLKGLLDIKEPQKMLDYILYLKGMKEEYRKNYVQVPGAKTKFPMELPLGNAYYPADVFSDSVGYQQLLDNFGAGSFLELPLQFRLTDKFNLFLNGPGGENVEQMAFTHHVMWSFLSFMPATKVNICVFDAERRGSSIVPFLGFRKCCPEVFDQKIYTDTEEMHRRLQKLNAQMDEIIQEKLAGGYENILEYNRNTPKRAETVTLLVLYDFPAGLDDRSMNLLSSILKNGSKCGIYVLVCHNPEIIYSRYERIDERLAEIKEHCIEIDCRSGNYSIKPYDIRFTFPENPSAAEAERFADAYKVKGEKNRKQGISFEDILPENLFSLKSDETLAIPVGIGDGDAIVPVTIGEGSSHHGLIAGATGSGKSTLLHTLIMSSMLNYSPDQLHLYLMDFKSGTEFKVYESVRLPHIQLLAIDAMQEFGESILENLVAEMEKRACAFKDEAGGVTKIKDYVETTGKAMPRILVVMDEFQILFNASENSKVARHCAELVKRIVTEGRAYGIHLLMATQSTNVISDLTLSQGTIEQMRIRVGLKCGESDARYLFGDQNGSRALDLMKGPIGTAVMNLDYTEQQSHGFRVAYCDDEMQRDYLQMISEKCAAWPYNLQIFEGSRTENLLDYYREASIGRTDDTTVNIHMGKLIKVAPPFSIAVDKKRKHNLLICGANEHMANMISNNYMISALLNENASVYCIDGDRLVGDDTSEELYQTLQEAFPRFKAAENRGDIIRFIKEVYDTYKERKKRNSKETIFMVIKNLQYLDIVKSMLKREFFDESEYLDEEPVTAEAAPGANPFSAIYDLFEERERKSDLSESESDSSESESDLFVGDKFVKMIEDGSVFGIHFVIMSQEYQAVEENMYYGGNVFSKFPERIIFSLGTANADRFIEDVSLTGMRSNTVYFTDGVKNTYQMKPYIAPSASELEEFLSGK